MVTYAKLCLGNEVLLRARQKFVVGNDRFFNESAIDVVLVHFELQAQELLSYVVCKLEYDILALCLVVLKNYILV